MFNEQIKPNQHRIWLLRVANGLFWGVIFLPFIIIWRVINIGNSSFDFSLTTLFKWILIIILISGSLAIHHQIQLLRPTRHLAQPLITKYHAKLIHNHDTYQILMDVTDEICTGLNLQSPEIYLIESDSIDNLMAIQQDDTNYLFITTHLLTTLNRYELEAVIAVRLIDLATDYQKLNLVRYCNYQNMLNMFKNHWFFLIFIWMMMADIGCLIIYASYYGLRYLSNQNIRQHLNHLNTISLQLTNNPQTLINALTKMSQTPTNFPVTNTYIDVLWFNPLDRNITWSLEKQIHELKLF